MEILIGIIIVLMFVVGFARVNDKSKIVKKRFKEFNESVRNGLFDDQILKMASEKRYAVYGVISTLLYDVKENIEYELEQKGLETDNFNHYFEFEIKDAEQELEGILENRFKFLYIELDTHGVLIK